MLYINSFDIFDTLLARRCIEAKNVFVELEELSGVKGIAAAREMAERDILDTEYDLDDIYDKLPNFINLTNEEVLSIKELEISIELRNAIPIKSNLSKVKDGDILVSDMYLSKDTILSLLNKIKLNKQTGLFVSSHGKSRYTVWPHINEKFHISSHLGDNLHSDVMSPRKFGIKSELCKDSDLNGHEKFFRDNGLETLARLVRELRLTQVNLSDSISVNRIKLNQYQNNIPFLLLASTYINSMAMMQEGLNILFCSRDCFNLRIIYGAVFGQNTKDKYEYFYTSRITRTNPSEDYLKYVRSKLSNNSLVVDLCGTGWSLGQLYNTIDLQPDTLLIHDISGKAGVLSNYEKIKSFKRPLNIKSIINDSNLDNTAIEIFNYADHGMSLDVKELVELNHFQPIFEPPNYPLHAENTINLMKDCQIQFIDVLAKTSIDKLRNELISQQEKIPGLMAELYKDMVNNIQHHEDLVTYHRHQDSETMLNLGC